MEHTEEPLAKPEEPSSSTGRIVERVANLHSVSDFSRVGSPRHFEFCKSLFSASHDFTLSSFPRFSKPAQGKAWNTLKCELQTEDALKCETRYRNKRSEHYFSTRFRGFLFHAPALRPGTGAPPFVASTL